MGDVAKWTTLVSDSFADKQHVLRNRGLLRRLPNQTPGEGKGCIADCTVRAALKGCEACRAPAPGINNSFFSAGN